MDVSDFVSKAYETPFGGRFIYSVGYVYIQGRALLEDVIKRQLANFRTHGCLRQLRYSEISLLDAVTINI